MNNIEEILPQLHEIQTKMAIELLDLCKKHGLHVWAGYGTLLGCVRHKGFIPWDDDMDFVMMREDFDRFRQLIKEGKVSPSNPNISFGIDRIDVTKLRYNGTSMVMPRFKLNERINQSVWIDIFCLDSIPEGTVDFESKYQYLRTMLRIDANAYQMSYASSRGIVSKAWHTFCNLHVALHRKRYIWEKVRKVLNSASKVNTSMVANILLYGRTEKYKKFSQIKKYKKEWFDETVYLPFDDIKLPCPKEYDSLLTEEYGDYMTPVKNASLHGETIIDLSRPYTAIIQEKLEKIPRWKRYFHMH